MKTLNNKLFVTPNGTCGYWLPMPVLTGETVEEPVFNKPGMSQVWPIAKCGNMAAKFSGGPIPAVGDTINIVMNKIGPARVEGYMIEHGFLGVIATPLAPPAWLETQHAENAKRNPAGPLNHVCGVYFAEFTH